MRQQQPQQAAKGFENPEKTQHGLGIVINAVEGFGKTTLGAFAEHSAIIMAAGETGYTTLFNRDLVPQRPQQIATDWMSLLTQLDALAEDSCEIKMLVLDALGGIEWLCHNYVCETQFDGDWGEKGFLSYRKGYDISTSEWVKLLARLDRLKSEQQMHVLLLSHCLVRPYKNPLGDDYDRYVADCHAKTWGLTHKWADVVLFGTFFTVVDKDNPQAKKGKAIGGTQRVLYTERRDAYDAKNRLGLTESIDLPNVAAEAWPTLKQHLFANGKAVR